MFDIKIGYGGERDIGRTTYDESFRFDHGRVDTLICLPLGSTDKTVRSIPSRDYIDDVVFRMSGVEPVTKYVIQRGRKINRGRVTTLENTPANPAKQGTPKIRGNGTL